MYNNNILMAPLSNGIVLKISLSICKISFDKYSFLLLDRAAVYVFSNLTFYSASVPMKF